LVALIEAASDATVCMDASGRIALVNAGVERLFGYRRDELIGQPVELLVPDGIPAVHPGLRAEYLVDTQPRPMGAGIELAGRRRDGTTFPAGISLSAIDADQGTLITAAIRDVTYWRLAAETSVARDITERQRADARFRALLEAVPDAMVCVQADGRIALVNAQTERLFGYQRDELVGQPVEMLVPEALRDAHRAHRAGYEGGPQHRPMGWGNQLAGRRRDGSTFPADISLSALDGDEGPLVAAAVRDMTEHQQVKDLERANQNMEAFAYSVAHDLRAPLRALSGFGEALLEDYGDTLDDEGRDYAGRIVEASEQMSALIDDLLRLSRISRAEVHLHAVDLGAEATRIAAELRRRDPGRRVRFAIQRPVQVLADPGLIQTVLQNLLENAWKFTSGQAEASIEFGADPAGDGRLRCYVRDNGAGFDPAYGDQLFQAFRRLHKTQEFPGTGVGLASVRQIVERHGGCVGAEGAVGKGAVFHFTIKAEEIT
jgi:PAS domain S-box-containing protein